jgi:3-deoxy-D-manno-octulosonate 8-phosphate phosphatase (KDO 8-P phosphatase)
MKNVKYLVLDVDGTLTDGSVYIGENGELCKAFNIKDGYGIVHIAIPAGLVPVVITGRNSGIVENRCKELGITSIHQDVGDKLTKLKGIMSANGSSLTKCAYMGDDLNDLEVMKAVKDAGGFIGCPADATEDLKTISHFVAEKPGGRGCVREFIEWLVS